MLFGPLLSGHSNKKIKRRLNKGNLKQNADYPSEISEISEKGLCILFLNCNFQNNLGCSHMNTVLNKKKNFLHHSNDVSISSFHYKR